MDMLDKLLVVACDAAPFYEYNYQSVVEEYRKKNGGALRSERADKGKRRKGDDGESVDVDIKEVVSPVKDKPDDSFPDPGSASASESSNSDSSGSDYSSDSDSSSDSD